MPKKPKIKLLDKYKRNLKKRSPKNLSHVNHLVRNDVINIGKLYHAQIFYLFLYNRMHRFNFFSSKSLHSEPVKVESQINKTSEKSDEGIVLFTPPAGWFF